LASSATRSASSIETMPICSPSAPINRTSRAEIFSLIGALGAARLSCLISRLIMITPILGDHAGKPSVSTTRQTDLGAWTPDLRLHGCGQQRIVSRLPDLQ